MRLMISVLLGCCHVFAIVQAQANRSGSGLARTSNAAVDSSGLANHYLSLASRAFKQGRFVQVLNFYEMAQACDDFIIRADTTNWIDRVREAQENQLRERDITILLLNKTRDQIEASKLALQSLSTEDAEEKRRFALEAYRKLPETADPFSHTEVMSALHGAYSRCRPSIEGLPGIQLVRQVNDSISLIFQSGGNFFLAHLGEESYTAEQKANVTALKVLQFTSSQQNDAFAFAGSFPNGRNRLMLLRDNELQTVRLPQGMKPVYALGFLNDALVFGGFDHAIYAYSMETRGIQRTELLAENEKISSMEVFDGKVYAGTTKGLVFTWDPKQGMDKISRAVQQTLVSKITVIGRNKLLVGYADGGLAVFDNKQEKKYNSQHRDYITELLVCETKDLIFKMSLDGRVSASRLHSGSNDPPISLTYDAQNPPVGISYCEKFDCLLIFLENGKLDVLHLNMNYYAEKLNACK
jgi:hypothetical protein